MLKYFNLYEKGMPCACCGKSEINIDFLLRLDKARMIADTQFKINSGYRCEKHNFEVGSLSNNHTSGHAVDIRCFNSPQRGRTLKGLYKAGFTRVGIRKDFIHVDDMDKVESCWLY